jgi:hypothetical protein
MYRSSIDAGKEDRCRSRSSIEAESRDGLPVAGPKKYQRRKTYEDGRPKQHGRQKKEGESPVGREQGHAGRRCASRGREQEAMRFVLYGGLGSGKLMGKEKRIVFFYQS